MICFGRLGRVECREIKDKEVARYIFLQAHLTEDKNRGNYSPEEFENAWGKWSSFFALYDNEHVVAFSGVRKFGQKYVRIFDRYFVNPDYRHETLNNAEYSLCLVQKQLERLENRIPFFSIESSKSATLRAAYKFNSVIGSEYFHVLDGKHPTLGGSLQFIAIAKPHETINLGSI